jgi:prepilin-type N-terminal cleavage/methylation domain-containing protein
MINLFKKNNKKNGFTLVEVLVAIFIFSLAIMAVMAALASGISNINYTKDKTTALYLAQEGVEYVRNMRDDYILDPAGYVNAGGWLNFITDTSSVCNGSNSCGFDSSVFPPTLFLCTKNTCELYVNNGNYNSNNSGTDSGFLRTVQITNDPSYPDEVKVISTVSWTEKTVNYSVSFSDVLFNWIE